ncbi:MAG: type II toxin-antitoxin system VapC family toxin [Thiohalocapsa sp.]
MDPLTARADEFITRRREPLLVSDLAAAEFASAIARRVRTREITLDQARSDLSDFDLWSLRSAQRVEVGASDVAAATAFLRRLDLTLLAPDAIHIAIVRRLGATLVTFDRNMASAGRALGVAVTTP